MLIWKYLLCSIKLVICKYIYVACRGFSENLDNSQLENETKDCFTGVYLLNNNLYWSIYSNCLILKESLILPICHHHTKIYLLFGYYLHTKHHIFNNIYLPVSGVCGRCEVTSLSAFLHSLIYRIPQLFCQRSLSLSTYFFYYIHISGDNNAKFVCYSSRKSTWLKVVSHSDSTSLELDICFRRFVSIDMKHLIHTIFLTSIKPSKHNNVYLFVSSFPKHPQE